MVKKQRMSDVSQGLIIVTALVTATKLRDAYKTYNVNFVEMFPEIKLEHM